jgi:hypothetical protein
MASLPDVAINHRNSSGNNLFGQFLNPEAMLTPGVTGALVMMITNGLASNFDIPRAYTGLFLSFVCGLLVLVMDRQWWIRAIYYVINSLIIFCVAFGANGLGAGVASTSAYRLGLNPVGIALAETISVAENDPGRGKPLAERSEPRDASEPSRAQLEQTIQQQRATIERLQQAHPSNKPAVGQQNGFFAPWTLK